MLFLANFVFPDSIQVWNLFFFIEKKTENIGKLHLFTKKIILKIESWSIFESKLFKNNFCQFSSQNFPKLLFFRWSERKFWQIFFPIIFSKYFRNYNLWVDISWKSYFLLPAIKAFLSKFYIFWFNTDLNFFLAKKRKKYRIAFFTKKSL